MPAPAPAAVAAALAVLAVPQALLAVQLQSLPGDAVLEVLPTGYSYGQEGEDLVFGFQLASPERALTVLELGSSVPGLELTDVVASGAALGFRAAGEGAADLPAFDLGKGDVVVVTLVYRLEACSAVPDEDPPLPVRVRAGGRSGTVQVPLPGLPPDDPPGDATALDPWPQVLARSVCR